MIRLKQLTSDGLTSITRLRNELISLVNGTQPNYSTSELKSEIMNIISEYIQDPQEVQFIVTSQFNDKIVLIPISDVAVELFKLLEL